MIKTWQERFKEAHGHEPTFADADNVATFIKEENAELRTELEMLKLILPVERGRPHFESLVTRLTNCQVGDGTLELAFNMRDYKNEYIQWLWMRYRHAGK